MERRNHDYYVRDRIFRWLQLDRNINKDGRGKYALIKIRVLDGFAKDTPEWEAFWLLQKSGVLCLGNESAGDQFFVMKYKDRFTCYALAAYAEAIRDYLRKTGERGSLAEFQQQIMEESALASMEGKLIPD